MKTCLRIVFALTGMILLIPAVMAQDTLLMKSGQKIVSQITEVTPSIIRYKKPENPDGPSYVIYKTEVNIIKYVNGKSDTIATPATVNTAAITTKTPVFQTPVTTVNVDPHPPITPSNNKYLYGSMRIKKPAMQDVLKSVNDEAINRHVKKAKLAGNFKWVGFVAIPPAALGLGFLALGAMDADEGIGLGLTCLGIAAVPFGTSITLRYVERKHNNAAIKIYNEKY